MKTSLFSDAKAKDYYLNEVNKNNSEFLTTKYRLRGKETGTI